jgi:hypothetical protein
MNRNEIRLEWRRVQMDANTRAEVAKQSQQAIYELITHYRALSDKERLIVDGLLAEDLDSTDEKAQFDALALIREFRIKSTLPALRVLASRLESEESPGAPYEWAKVNSLIGSLSSAC